MSFTRMKMQSEFEARIDNADLRLSDLRQRDAPWDTIQKFALTFDGYRHNGSFERCAEIANSRKHDSLSDLRTCLFFEQRRWRQFGEEPDADALTYIRTLVDQIRDRVSRRELD